MKRMSLLIEHHGIGAFGCGIDKDKNSAEEDHDEAEKDCKRRYGAPPLGHYVDGLLWFHNVLSPVLTCFAKDLNVSAAIYFLVSEAGETSCGAKNVSANC